MPEKLSLNDALKKLERYCAYQERCHQEVTVKLQQLGVTKPDRDTIIVSLIENNYLNEERFARSFARGKHRIKGWGQLRIVNELKARQISAPNIKCALSEVSEAEYEETFQQLAQRHWDSLLEKHPLKKRQKFCDYLLRKGWESDRVYAKAKALSGA
ncbi:regulatory protein RecX [Flavobacterium sp. XGLA_31]|uniref:regulatory protein RecX n=1 Tax=Flavobacterium sp. XGLA_31 TaxID=3447666 RepID=UPI003F309CA1